jgi:hypothetical protein
MSTILLAADSWGVGVFANDANGEYGPTGEGIHNIFSEHKHNVINISKGGGSNWLMIDRLNSRWGKTNNCYWGSLGAGVPHCAPYEMLTEPYIAWDQIDHIVFIQTDIFRDQAYYAKRYPTSEFSQWKTLTNDFIKQLMTYNSISDFIIDYFAKMYTALNQVGVDQNKKILCVGGWSKLHPMINDYKNLIPVVTSCPELLIPGFTKDTYMSDFEYWVTLSENVDFVNHFGDEFKQFAIDVNEKYTRVTEAFMDSHPKMDGYRRIADKILPYLGW